MSTFDLKSKDNANKESVVSSTKLKSKTLLTTNITKGSLHASSCSWLFVRHNALQEFREKVLQLKLYLNQVSQVPPLIVRAQTWEFGRVMDFLPAGFSSPDEYLEAAVDFLARYEWLYNWPVTEILSSGVLDRLPLDWWQPLRRLSVEELNQLPRGRGLEEVPAAVRWPTSLRELVRSCAALRLPVADSELSTAAPLRPALRHALRKGLTPKKLHEVTHLAELVHRICQRTGIKCVVDMGSGHGYLCEVLYHEFGYRVLGLESVPARVREARHRHEAICRALRVPHVPGVHYMVCDVSGDAPDPIVSALAAWLDEDGHPAPFCLVGLHSCGDLTPSAMRLFRDIEQLRAMALVSCCYHLMARHSCDGPAEVVSPGRPDEHDEKVRLMLHWTAQHPRVEQQDLAHWMGSLLSACAPAEPEHFRHFPLSAQLKRVLGARPSTSPAPSLFLRRPMLRLAAQETVERWEMLSAKSHQNHSVHIMSRAVFHLYTTSQRLRVQKRTRRCARRGQAALSPEAVLSDMVERMLEAETEAEAAGHKQALCRLLAALDPLRPLLEALTGLQVALQSVCEGLVLVDRLLALSGTGTASIVRVADQVFTPRCFALVATK